MEDISIVTGEDIEYFGLWGSIIQAVTVAKRDNFVPEIMYQLSDLPPVAFKRLSQAYWGAWCGSTGLRCVHIKNGELVKEWTLPSIGTNLPIAVTLIQQVTRRVHGAMVNGGILCYIDSVLIPYQLRTGEDPGEWKHLQSFDKGIYVKAAGCWDSLPDARTQDVSLWYRHSGWTAAIPRRIPRTVIQEHRRKTPEAYLAR
jgi:hypothetical protein